MKLCEPQQKTSFIHGELLSCCRSCPCSIDGSPYFSAPAVWRIHRYSAGIPRLVNALADKCLLAAFVQKRDRVNYGMVGTAIRELEGHIRV